MFHKKQSKIHGYWPIDHNEKLKTVEIILFSTLSLGLKGIAINKFNNTREIH